MAHLFFENNVVDLKCHLWVTVDTDNSLIYLTFKNVILITCVIEDGDKFYPQLFSEEAFVA